ncbi:hypothetical protein SBA4_380026 [Candidatus Sulfopaludibacter sp. SbA4]|nr:hypothetical protein SBA4_380026 [Candidatus Sulfopaludibacter sp. SbA4]
MKIRPVPGFVATMMLLITWDFHFVLPGLDQYTSIRSFRAVTPPFLVKPFLLAGSAFPHGKTRFRH